MIDPSILAFAREKRAAGVSWQHIGRMTGVNAETLRLALAPIERAERAVIEAMAPKPKPPPLPKPSPGYRKGRREPTQMRVLRALSLGHEGFAKALANVVDTDWMTVSNALSALRQSGDVDQAAKRTAYFITPRGRRTLAAFDRLKGAA